MSQRGSESTTKAEISADATPKLAEGADAPASGPQPDAAELPQEVLRALGGPPEKREKLERRLAAADIRQKAFESIGVTSEEIAKLRQRLEHEG